MDVGQTGKARAELRPVTHETEVMAPAYVRLVLLRSADEAVAKRDRSGRRSRRTYGPARGSSQQMEWPVDMVYLLLVCVGIDRAVAVYPTSPVADCRAPLHEWSRTVAFAWMLLARPVSSRARQKEERELTCMRSIVLYEFDGSRVCGCNSEGYETCLAPGCRCRIYPSTIVPSPFLYYSTMRHQDLNVPELPLSFQSTQPR